MKFNKIFLAALAAGMMASCSNDQEPVQNPAGPEATGDGYLAVTIKLPSQAGTRAANDNFAQPMSMRLKMLLFFSSQVIMERLRALRSSRLHIVLTFPEAWVMSTTTISLHLISQPFR